MKQRMPKRNGGATSTAIETAWLCAHYAHGMSLPAWLYSMLAHVRQQVEDGRLPMVIVPAGERQESLVVMTLADFLTWRQHCATRNDSTGNEYRYFHRRRTA